MTKYQFSTIKLIPSLVRDEPVNIGVILYDSEKNKAYPKFTKNWKEVSNRTGIEKLPDLNKILQIQTIKTNDNFLNSLSSKNFQDSLIITKPKIISIIETPQETLERLFETQISLPSLDTTEDKISRKFEKWLGNTIKSMNFPEKTYRPKYIFKNTVVEKSFPYVFIKKEFPFVGIDYINFLPSTVINTTKIKSFDIGMVRNSQSTRKTDFKLFATQDKDEIILSNNSVKKSMDILDHLKIPVIYKGDSEYELDKIRKIVIAA